MKKSLWIFLILFLIAVIIVFVFNGNNKEDGYIAESVGFNNKDTEEQQDTSTTKETVISSFSTKLPKDTKARENNIKLACKTLNETIIKSGETFSFWDTLGCPTKETGYEKAKTFTSDGEVTESYGGGVCQISTTIYNAALKIKELEIKERHEHSREVTYIEDGKDAAVSYNTADLKFKNTLEYDIKMQAKVEDNKVKIKLIRI